MSPLNGAGCELSLDITRVLALYFGLMAWDIFGEEQSSQAAGRMGEKRSGKNRYGQRIGWGGLFQAAQFGSRISGLVFGRGTRLQ